MDANIPPKANTWSAHHCNGSTSTQSSLPSSSSMANDDEQQPIRKKSWSELKESVTELRKQLSRLSTMIPMNIEFRKLTDGRTRIYFLGTPPNGWETTLLCTDITPAMLTNQSDDEQMQQRTRYLSDIRIV